MTNNFIIEVNGLTKKFKGFLAVENLDLKIKRHTIHALIGPNGAGKTTCFNLITKFLQPTEGAIKFNGKDITHFRPDVVARMGMVRSFQISAVFSRLSALDNIIVALQRRTGQGLYFWRSDKSLNPLKDEAYALLEKVGIEQWASVLAGEMSYGRKRVLEIATTLALDPEVLLLDEPMAGMGIEDIQRITALIKTISKNRTVVMVEHNLSVVADLSDRISVLKLGKMLAEGSYDEISNNPDVIDAYMGHGAKERSHHV
jgi:branched-chain amino acid transport system ATP-binding protein